MPGWGMADMVAGTGVDEPNRFPCSVQKVKFCMPPDTMPFDTALTDLGNLAVVGPAAIVCWYWLLRRWDVSIAWRFLCAFAATFAAVCGLKVVSRMVGDSLVGTPFALSTGAPSGHMAMTTLVYGGMAVLLLRLDRSPISLLAAVFIAITLIGVGVTRVILQAHTPADVVIGFGLGCASAAWVCWGARPTSSRPARHTVELLAALVATVILMHLSGFRLDSAKFI
jgi:membrane-associated phospholipid phosphatase